MSLTPCSRLVPSLPSAIRRACRWPALELLEPLAPQARSEFGDHRRCSRLQASTNVTLTMSSTPAPSVVLEAPGVAEHPSKMLLLCLRTTAKSSRLRDPTRLTALRTTWDHLFGLLRRLSKGQPPQGTGQPHQRPPLGLRLPSVLSETLSATVSSEDNRHRSIPLHLGSPLYPRSLQSLTLDLTCALARWAWIHPASDPTLIPA